MLIFLWCRKGNPTFYWKLCIAKNVILKKLARKKKNLTHSSRYSSSPFAHTFWRFYVFKYRWTFGVFFVYFFFPRNSISPQTLLYDVRSLLVRTRTSVFIFHFSTIISEIHVLPSLAFESSLFTSDFGVFFFFFFTDTRHRTFNCCDCPSILSICWNWTTATQTKGRFKYEWW